jgi:hypothetical protein
VIEVRMRDENGLEAPALRGDAISQLLRIADPELGIHEDGLVLAVDEGRRHADTLGVGGVDIERERGGFRTGDAAATEGTRNGKRGNGSSAEDPESKHVAPVRHVRTFWPRHHWIGTRSCVGCIISRTSYTDNGREASFYV